MNPNTTTPLTVPLRAPAPGASATLYCFPHAGGDPDTFLPLARLLPPHVTPVGINLPADETGGSVFPTVRAAAAAIATAVTDRHVTPGSAQGDGFQTIGLLGHSGGGLLAYETARSLHDHRVPLALLAVSSVPAPAAAPQLIRQLSNPQRFEQTVHEALGLATNNRTLAAFAFRRDLPMYTAYTYEEGAPLDYPIAVHGGDEDPVAPHTDLAEWASYTTARCTVRTYPGGHMYLRNHWGALATHLGNALTAGRTDI
ncbi:thioesterase II family protein [Kitasatospora sp. LaBMicrA B282]|uniref:thioesterase II family protein n=1 Tax=Kitasatospora sp. LaBMicrA B282 TaxID=3420949 RepID=UPI003D103819